MAGLPVPDEREILVQGCWASAGFFSATQDIQRGTIWSIHSDIDTVVLHLNGPITRLETELEGCGSTFDPPMPGEVWIIPAGQRYHTEAKGGVVRYAELHLNGSELNSITGRSPTNRRVRPRAGYYDGFLHRAVLHLEALAKRSDDLSRMTAESLSHTLALDFYARYGGMDTLGLNNGWLWLTAIERRRVEEFVDANLGEELRLDRLAEKVHMTVHEFLIAFRAAFGVTPAQYVIECRLRRARWLLLNTPKTVATVAFETGFSSHAHLSTTFRTRLHMTPQEFRRNR